MDGPIGEDSLWDADAKSAVRALLAGAEWDITEKVVYLPDVDVRGDRTTTAVTSLDELGAHLQEEAFQGYNQFGAARRRRVGVPAA